MPVRKSFDLDGLAHSTTNNINRLDPSLTAPMRGIQGDNLIEPVPSFIKRPSEHVIEGANNAAIVLGRDRPGEVGSGHSKETGAGAIDLVAGRMSSNVQTSLLSDRTNSRELVHVDPNMALDASRIYISQKTDIDTNFNLDGDRLGSSMSRAGIGIKSDAVRIMAREGVKIVTKIDTHNSQGGGIISVPPIELIAGNDASNQQPAVKGASLNKIIKDIMQKITDLNQIVDSFITSQMEYNSVLMSHQHPDPVMMTLGALSSGNPMAINGGNVPFSPEVLQAGIKAMCMQQVTKHDGVMHNLQTAVSEMSSAEIHGADNCLSTNITLS